ncbi:DUF4136 domain-containing protein [Altererythrobacter aurantiacus]|uniref:DUF4136 domain-containing protein n=1 Tax=Parapontixanthobacter aurantiacus TaxID=1463599 RepID=A0A844ZGT9_9SPHN|nr:DUF4136 domain-containing protein [Parapontixanthobacter aurantiacus]MXO86366.1 DUF4136 domain-containing protein [Parapontixanthobacter aurantiacus]
MRKFVKLAATAVLSASLIACAAKPGPVQVTRFHDNLTSAPVQSGTVFVESADDAGLSASPYKTAVAAELAALGYRETTRANADYVARVDVERFAYREGERRGPVSVGVGGGTGTYGSGLGLGIGINLGGNSGERIGTELSVALAPSAGGQNIWEGRAQFLVPPKSPLAEPQANAETIANALFENFPGMSGETVEVAVE